MKHILVNLLLIMAITGCYSHAVERYSISADNVVAIRSLGVKELNVGEFTSFSPGLKEIICRGSIGIKPPDGTTFEEYIRKALIDELKISAVYSQEASIILTGRLEHIDFNSHAGKWNLSLFVNSSNGKSIKVSEDYKYVSSHFGIAACGSTAQALMPAVQDLINNLVTDQNFPTLIK